MRTSKYSEEQIIGFLRQAEAAMPVREIVSNKQKRPALRRFICLDCVYMAIAAFG